jgi:ornithine--oxo-acid transaminase
MQRIALLESDLPNLVQMDAPRLAGLLAERLLSMFPTWTGRSSPILAARPFKAAMKFARAATARPGIVYCNHAFHGLS